MTKERLRHFGKECMRDTPVQFFPEKKDWSEWIIDADQVKRDFEDQFYGLACSHVSDNDLPYYDELDFVFDHYDHSVEVYFSTDIPSSWSPCQNMVNAVYAMGFGIVYWNFQDNSEIRGGEARRDKKTKEPV